MFVVTLCCSILDWDVKRCVSEALKSDMCQECLRERKNVELLKALKAKKKTPP